MDTGYSLINSSMLEMVVHGYCAVIVARGAEQLTDGEYNRRIQQIQKEAYKYTEFAGVPPKRVIQEHVRSYRPAIKGGKETYDYRRKTVQYIMRSIEDIFEQSPKKQERKKAREAEKERLPKHYRPSAKRFKGHGGGRHYCCRSR